MRDGWRTYKLGSICDFQGGSQPPKGEWIKSPREGYVRMLQIRDFTKSRDFDIEYVRITDKLRLCKDDDILIGRYGASVGKILTGLSGAYNVAIIKTIPDESVVCKSFIRRVLEAPGFHELLAKVSTQRTAQAGFSKEDIADYEVSLPSLTEQQRIVDILDQEFAKIDALKSNAEKSLQAAKDLFQKSMDVLLSPKDEWIETTLGEICSKIGSGATPSGGKRAYQNTGISLIRSLNVHNNEFRYEDLAHISSSQALLLDNVEIHSGDVLFNITGASVARCCLVPDDVIPARVNQHVSILRLKPGTLLPSLLVFIMISPYQNERLMKTAENGATRQAITKRELEEWVIKFPGTTEEQQVIIAHLNDLDNKRKALQENYQKTLTLCDDLKQSLLRKAFNGEL